jgi:exodeoxyribonuclease VII small subunit
MMNETEQKTTEKLTFEEALARLEATVGRMEAGDLPLEKAMEAFEEGMKLAKFCNEMLGQTENKIEVLMQKMGQEPHWEKIEENPEQ